MKRWIPLLVLALSFLMSPLAVANGDHDRDSLVFNHSFSSSKGRLGVQVNGMTEELRQFFGAPKDAGLLVARVIDDSPADKAGIKVGDVIIEVEGESVEDVGDVISALRQHDGDKKVPVVLVRRKKKITKKVALDNDRGSDSPPFGRSNQSLVRELERTQRQIDAIEQRLRAIEGQRTKPHKPSKSKAKKKKKKKKEDKPSETDK